MPQLIHPIVNATQIHAIRIDVDAAQVTIDYSQGIQDEAGTYQPIHRLSKVLDGEAFAALCSRPVKVEDASSMQFTSLYEVIKAALYHHVTP